MGNELTASLYTSVNWLERRRQDLFDCQNVKEIPFPCAGEIGDRHWYILPGFQYQSLKEGSGGVELSSTILARRGGAALAQKIRKVSFWFTMSTAKHFCLSKLLLVVTLPRLNYIWL